MSSAIPIYQGSVTFCYLTQLSKRADSRYSPDELMPYGDHLITRRLDLKLTKRAIAARLGTDDVTTYLLENNRFLSLITLRLLKLLT
jgi:hypothetical protein